MNATYLYHKDIFLPSRIAGLGKTRIALRPTRHASEAALSDRYGKIEIPSTIEFCGKNVVEAELTGGKLTKLVVRLPYGGGNDAIYVFLPDGTLKTVWLNRSNDTHKTLKRHLYAVA